MPSTVTVQFRMDKDLKDRLDAMLADMGLTVSTAMNHYAKAIVNQARIPFDIKATTTTDRDSFLSLAGKIDIDDGAVTSLREGSKL